ncbi:hypothetical protein [Vagococcus sp. WN89Y]|uniref:hypothetical protein n=1 Tax=Vagococcus sp. WN89Y TaxID=3457258 RepID=UPI003FCE8989
MNLKNKIFVFWGIMDVLALASYFVFSLQSGNIPFYSDIKGFYNTYPQLGVSGLTGGFLQFLFLINIALIVSLVFSAWMMTVKKEINNVFFIVQEIARLLSLKCSLTLIPLFLHFTGFSVAWVAITLFLLSEVLKIASVSWAKRKNSPQTDAALSR